MQYDVKKIEQQLKDYGITDEKIIGRLEGKLLDILSVIESNEFDNEILWDKTVERYYKSTKKLKKILSDENIKDSVSSYMMKNLDNFLEVCKHPEFHIAFVGAIKAGKSTLINALLGKNLASTGVTPETASLTKFRATKGTNYINLSFYSEDEWKELWESVQLSKADVFLEEYKKLDAESIKSNWINKGDIRIELENLEDLRNEIKKWTSSKEGTHYFVKEVEVGLKDFNLPEGVVFIDTPGLDDPVKYRSDITRMYIDRANAVFVCVKSDALTGQELRTIYSVFANSRYNPEKVYVIGTQLDSLNRPKENWKEQREEWLKHLSKNDCYGSMKLAQNNLLITAAYLYNMCIDFGNLSEDDIYYELEPIARKFRIRNVEEDLDKLIDFSQIENLKMKLEKEVIEKYKVLLVNDIKSSYQSNKEDIEDLLNKIKKNQLEILELTNKDIEKIQEEKEKNERILEENKKEKENIEHFLEQVKIITTKRAEELYKEIKKIGGGVNV